MNTFFLPPKALSFTLVFLTVFIIRCGSFQGASYYAADGIYSNGTTTVVKRVETRSPSNNGAYYSEYFQNLTDEYSSTESNNDNAIERFRHMSMVDVIITKIGFCNKRGV